MISDLAVLKLKKPRNKKKTVPAPQARFNINKD